MPKLLEKKPDCLRCPDSMTHPTGSQIWLSRPFQKGWRDINTVCNLTEEQRCK
jgi:hypothetical protein